MTATRRGFYQYTRAWYAKYNSMPNNIFEDIMIGLYPEEGGTEGEFSIKWYKLGKGDFPAARLEVFEDAWGIIPLFNDLLDHLYELHKTEPMPDDIVKVLHDCGIEDLTLTDEPKFYKEE